MIRKHRKWGVTIKEYPKDTYPPYCTGAAIVYTCKNIQKIVDASEGERYFFIDDVFVTGIVREIVGVKLQKASREFGLGRKLHRSHDGRLTFDGSFLFVNGGSVSSWMNLTKQEMGTTNEIDY